jgi:hypothetical protein
MNSAVYIRKVDTRHELLARILDDAARIKKPVKINSDENHVIFAHEMQSALNLTVGLPDIYCELQQNCNFSVTNLSFEL